MKKYAQNGQKRGVDSFAGKVSDFKAYLAERREFAEWLLDTMEMIFVSIINYTAAKGGNERT